MTSQVLAPGEAEVAWRVVCAVKSLRLFLLRLGPIRVDTLFVRAGAIISSVSLPVRIIHVHVIGFFRSPRMLRVLPLGSRRRSRRRRRRRFRDLNRFGKWGGWKRSLRRQCACPEVCSCWSGGFVEGLRCLGRSCTRSWRHLGWWNFGPGRFCHHQRVVDWAKCCSHGMWRVSRSRGRGRGRRGSKQGARVDICKLEMQTLPSEAEANVPAAGVSAGEGVWE